MGLSKYIQQNHHHHHLNPGVNFGQTFHLDFVLGTYEVADEKKIEIKKNSMLRDMELANHLGIISFYIWSIFILLSAGLFVSTTVFESNFGTLKIFKKNRSQNK